MITRIKKYWNIFHFARPNGSGSLINNSLRQLISTPVAIFTFHEYHSWSFRYGMDSVDGRVFLFFFSHGQPETPIYLYFLLCAWVQLIAHSISYTLYSSTLIRTQRTPSKSITPNRCWWSVYQNIISFESNAIFFTLFGCYYSIDILSFDNWCHWLARQTNFRLKYFILDEPFAVKTKRGGKCSFSTRKPNTSLSALLDFSVVQSSFSRIHFVLRQLQIDRSEYAIFGSVESHFQSNAHGNRPFVRADQFPSEHNEMWPLHFGYIDRPTYKSAGQFDDPKWQGQCVDRRNFVTDEHFNFSLVSVDIVYGMDSFGISGNPSRWRWFRPSPSARRARLFIHRSKCAQNWRWEQLFARMNEIFSLEQMCNLAELCLNVLLIFFGWY